MGRGKGILTRNHMLLRIYEEGETEMVLSRRIRSQRRCQETNVFEFIDQLLIRLQRYLYIICTEEKTSPGQSQFLVIQLFRHIF